MKAFLIFNILLFSLSFQAEALVSPVGFSFTHKGDYLTFPKEDWSVYGIRTNVFGAKHKKMIGFDFGGANITEELFAGTQAGVINANLKKAYIVGIQLAILYNHNKGDLFGLGFQVAPVNYNEGSGTLLGVQFGVLANVSKKTRIVGMQIGLYNSAARVIGIQFGIVNVTEDLHGIQLGLVNSCKSCLIKIMPGVNIGF